MKRSFLTSILIFIIPISFASANLAAGTRNPVLLDERTVGLNEIKDFEVDEQGQRTYDELVDVLHSDPEFLEFLRIEEEYIQEYNLIQMTNYNPDFLLEYSDDDFSDPRELFQLIAGKKCVPGSKKILSGCCLMYVRLYLQQKKLIPAGTSLGTHAKGAGNFLSKLGFRNVIKQHNARSAPIGSVLVYKGGSSGHAEIKLGNSKFYFGPQNAIPATEWRSLKRTLTGVWVK